MRVRPISFSAPMVRALLAGRKTQTRRIIRPEARSDIREGDILISWPANAFLRHSVRFHPPVRQGDRLYVREAWRTFVSLDGVKPTDLYIPGKRGAGVLFEADNDGLAITAGGDITMGPREDRAAFGKLRPSMFMPRWASRITLIVTDVRVQRLQDISEEDAIAEGIEGDPVNAWRCYAPEPKNQTHWADPRESYRTLWDSINGDRPGCAWRYNPWVVAYTFRPILGNVDAIAEAA